MRKDAGLFVIFFPGTTNQSNRSRRLIKCAKESRRYFLDPFIVNGDDIAHRTQCIFHHGGSLLLIWLRLATSSSARFGAASPI
jgi:hypothetical protein